MRVVLLVSALATFAVFGATGCGGPPACVPGSQVACACPSGTSGTQLCGGGGVFGPCACRPAAPAPAPSPAPIVPVAPPMGNIVPPTAGLRLVPATTVELRDAVSASHQAGCRGVPTQTFRIEGVGSPLDGAVLAPIECGGEYEEPRTAIVIVRAGSLLQTMDIAATWGSGSVQAIALRDLNGDSNPDLIAVLSRLHGAGPCSSTDEEFPFVALLGSGRFEAIPESALNAVDQGISEDCVTTPVTVQSVTRALAGRL